MSDTSMCQKEMPVNLGLYNYYCTYICANVIYGKHVYNTNYM